MRPAESAWRRGLLKALVAVAIAGGIGGIAASNAQAGDDIFFEGYADTGGAWAPSYVKLTQIDIRSLDGHSACAKALSGLGGYSSPACTNSIIALTAGLNGPTGTALWKSQAYSGWPGNYVLMRGRQYYN